MNEDEIPKHVSDIICLELERGLGRYIKENPSSGNVLKKLGFQYEKDILYECNRGSVLREGIQCRLYLD